jgi:stage II sporulation protein GA (sporulation sigma-E factor processing peptidase)
MRESIEAYFLINFVVDTALIAVVARANGCLKLRRALAGGLLAALYTVAVAMFSERLAHPAIQLLLAIVLGLIVTGNPDPLKWGAVTFQLACAAMLLGGLGILWPSAGIGGLVAVLGIGLVLLHLLLSVRANRLLSWEVTVYLQFRGQSAVFKALIDTGNRLREPISGLPVLIAESELLKDLLPRTSKEPYLCRKVTFGALGGGGTIRCFHPDRVLIRRGDRLVQAPEVWVALYPGKMPGASRALAPPAFAVIPGKS